MSKDWHSSVGFSDRLSYVVKIIASYKHAHPTAPATDAQKEAKALEDEAFKLAGSKEDYQNRCELISQELADKNADTSAENGDDYFVPEETSGMDIGKYKNAIYHKDGLFSTVFRANAPKSNEHITGTVALKVASPDSEEPPHDSLREIRLLHRAKSTNVIPLLEDFPQAGGRLVLVFPFLPHALDQLLEDKRLSKKQEQACLKDMFNAIAHLHSLHILHRDIKPSNILLRSPDGPAYLADFGIAWKEDDPASEPASEKITDVGTTSYRPPELLFGNKSYNSSLDMWAAGCVVAQVVSLHENTLFDAGDLGSELALIHSIFVNLGTPNLEVWPEAARFPDWGKMEFYQYPPKDWQTLLPAASEIERELVKGLVRYESGERLCADEVLNHPYFQEAV